MNIEPFKSPSCEAQINPQCLDSMLLPRANCTGQSNESCSSQLSAHLHALQIASHMCVLLRSSATQDLVAFVHVRFRWASCAAVLQKQRKLRGCVEELKQTPISCRHLKLTPSNRAQHHRHLSNCGAVLRFRQLQCSSDLVRFLQVPCPRPSQVVAVLLHADPAVEGQSSCMNSTFEVGLRKFKRGAPSSATSLSTRYSLYTLYAAAESSEH